MCHPVPMGSEPGITRSCDGVRVLLVVVLVSTLGIPAFGVRKLAEGPDVEQRDVHVTRLLRHEKQGLAAMIQSEQIFLNFSDAAVLHERTDPAAKDFVRLSTVQFDTLRLYHLRMGFSSGSSKKSDTSSHADAVKAADDWALSDGTAVMGLSNLHAEYVGPIGVGTQITPQSCAANLTSKKARSRLAQIFGQASNDEDAFLEEAHAKCHVTELEHIWVVFDTGSTNIWISSDHCKDGPCTFEGRHRFNHSNSVTFVDPHRDSVEVSFGTGTLRGRQGIDDIHVGPLSARRQDFLMIAEQIGDIFEDIPFDGILGLGFPSLSVGGVTPFFDNLARQRVLKKNVFAFYFHPDDSSANAIFWGGDDPAFHKSEELAFFNVIEPYYWSLRLYSFKIGDNEFFGDNVPLRGVGPPRAIVDTGTTLFTADCDTFSKILKALPPSACSDVTEEKYPNMTFTLMGEDEKPHDIVLTYMEYMTASSAKNSDTCSPGFMQLDLPESHGPAMIIGEVFMRTYFTLFDRGDGDVNAAKVGFARASHGQETTARIRHFTASQPTFTGHAF
mmetsp:Transcript_25803/g.71914  ORF Transcript_25803/g.71914 Transcript_25803/m.71914 type:complete len:557 (-) Transcript_25803:104-1774(-)